MDKLHSKRQEYIVFSFGIISGIASILSLFLTESFLPQLAPYKKELLVFTIPILLILFIIQYVRNKDFTHWISSIRNFAIKFVVKYKGYDDFRTQIIKDNSSFCFSNESIKTAHSNHKVYISLEPRMTINSVQLSLFSKLKEITSYGIKAEIFLDDFNLEENVVKYYKKVLKRFLVLKPYEIYRLSELDNEEISRIFKLNFENGASKIKICWLLNRSAELMKTRYRDDGKLKFDIFLDDILNNTILFNKREVFTSDILSPIFEIVNMQTLLDKNGNQHHYFALSGANMANFWTETKDHLNHNFTPLLMPLIQNLTNNENAISKDLINCISLSKADNETPFSNINNITSILEHYKMILFKNIDVIGMKQQKKRVMCFDNCFHFSSYDEMEIFVNRNFGNEDDKKIFLTNNFKIHLNKLIEYVN